MFKQQKGATLLSLVAAIIAMLALVAVAVVMVLDELSYDPEPVQVYNEQKVESTDVITTTQTQEIEEIIEAQ